MSAERNLAGPPIAQHSGDPQPVWHAPGAILMTTGVRETAAVVRAVTPKTVEFAALGRQHEPLMPELQLAFDRVLGASSFILGEEVEQFESEFAAYCGVPHCVGVASGTAALVLLLE